jgi:TolB protein
VSTTPVEQPFALGYRRAVCERLAARGRGLASLLRLLPVLLIPLLACGSPKDTCARHTPGAPWLAFATHRSGDYDIWIARADGTCQHPLAAARSMELHPAWSVNDVIAFTSDRSGALRVWLHDLSTGDEAMLDTGTIRATSPSFSPDGATLAFEGRADGATDTDLYVVPTAGGTPTAVATDPHDDAGPVWSPDGSTLYFVSTRSGAYELHAVVVATGVVTRLTTGSRIVGRPVVLPAGDRLYFARTVSGSAATEVVRFVLATGATELVSSQGDSEPAISPAGDRVAMRTFRYGDANAEIAIADEADGGDALRITSDPDSDGSPTFAPAR